MFTCWTAEIENK